MNRYRVPRFMYGAIDVEEFSLPSSPITLPSSAVFAVLD